MDLATAPAPTRPLLRYHGGKWRLAPWIISHFPAHRVYVEPFGGGASVLLSKPRTYAEVYNDLDGEIVNLFRVARDNGEELLRQLSLTPFSREDFNRAYVPADCPIVRARNLMIRAYLGHGGDSASSCHKTGFRCDSNRRGTTPAHDWKNLPKHLPRIVARLQGVVIEQRPALDIIRKFDRRDTLFYVDPPYVPGTRGRVRGYRHEMTEHQHIELGELLNQVRGAVILSGYPSELYESLYKSNYGWTCIERSALADGARRRTECLWLRNCAPAQMDLL